MNPPLPPEDLAESIEAPAVPAAPPAATSATLATSRVTKVTGDLTLVAPDDCSASVLLKLVDAITGSANPRQNKRVFACWLLAGRHNLKAIKVPYVHDQIDTIRIDIPEGQSVCTSYLQRALREAWEKDPTLPPDTPVVKG